MKNYYSILQINTSASSVEVKSAYRNLSKKYHPDVNKATNATIIFIEIKEAYEVLIDENRRKDYDYFLNTSFRKQEQVNIQPKIHFFYCDVSHFALGDVVTFSWDVSDAEFVELRPFGKVVNTGSKKIRITDVSTNLLVELFCYNSISRNYVFSQMTLFKRDVVKHYVTPNKKEIFEQAESKNPLNLKKSDSSKKIKIFNFKINQPDILELFIWIFSLANLFVYFSYPYFFIEESQLQATRAYSKTENGLTDYFIEFDDFKVQTSRQMAENLQSMEQRTVYFGVSTKTNEVAYFRIKSDSNSIKQEVSGYSNVGSFIFFYFFILILQFYLTFFNEKIHSRDNFGFILGFLFVFSLAMSYVLYVTLF